MIQVKIIVGKSIENLNEEINSFLSNLSTDDVRDISINATSLTGIVHFEIKDKWSGHMCCDCTHWDDSGQSSSVVGLCQFCGGRKRFNSKACSDFVDVRR